MENKRFCELTPEEKKVYFRGKSLARYYANKEGSAEKARSWRESNKEYIRNKQRETKQRRKLQAIEYKGGRCEHCGNKYHPAVFEFHHKDPDIKIKDPSKMLTHSWKALEKELDKCLLLCANCHRLEHHEKEIND